MAQKKKKGKPPQKKSVQRQRLSVSMIIFYSLGILVILSMVISTFASGLSF
jgi:hypothetical protein